MSLFFIKGVQLLLSLSILIVLHELGHFIPAKLFKTRVEKFYLFFDVKFSLFKKKIGDTVYGIGWLPLGGYVKISGMIDESMDTEHLNKDPEPWEFRSKPAWQRLIIMIGGVTVNVILGMAIYAMVLFVWGTQYLPTENLKYGVYTDSSAVQIGLQNGDKILSVDGEKVENFSDIQLKILLEEAQTVEVERNGNQTQIDIPEGTVAKMIKKQQAFMEPAYLPLVDQVLEGSKAEAAGLEKGDRLLAINGEPTPFFQDVVKTLQKHKEKAYDRRLRPDRAYMYGQTSPCFKRLDLKQKHKENVYDRRLRPDRAVRTLLRRARREADQALPHRPRVPPRPARDEQVAVRIQVTHVASVEPPVVREA